MQWNGDHIVAQVEAEMERRLDAAAFYLQARMKENLSTEGAGMDARGRLIYGANPSKPGEFPHVQTGRLRGSIAIERTQLKRRIGTNVVYGRPLELSMDRAFASRTLAEEHDVIQRILTMPL